MLNTLSMLVFPAVLAYAAASDLLTMKISNKVSLFLIGAFAVMALMVQMPIALAGTHLATALVVLLVTFTLFSFGWIGGGDAKLAAAIALWVGFPLAISFLLTAAIWGGGLTIVFLLLRRWPLPAGLLGVEWIGRLHDNSNGVPYGIALAAAGMMVYPQTMIFTALAS